MMTVRIPLLAVILASTLPLTATSADLSPEAERLLATDKAFARLAQEIGVSEAFRKHFAADGMELRALGAPLVGNDAVADSLKGDFVITWEPQHAEVAASGDMGWTWGKYEVRPKKDAPVSTVGTYLDVWYKQPDGSWRIRIENGNQAKAPTAPTAPTAPAN